MTSVAEPASFRDPAGFVFRRAGTLFRQVNRSYAPTLERLEQSGFLRDLQRDGLLIGHERLSAEEAETPDAAAVLRPDVIPFISYPYEWCFGQLRDAALLTLDLQRRALDTGFTLRDASAYNVQFVGGSAVFIDSLSFGLYTEGEPWQAYGQFCAHFLAPLALMATRDVRLGAVQRSFTDGIPLDLTSRLLGSRTRFRAGLLLHVHAHAKSQRRLAPAAASRPRRTLSPAALRRLVAHLRETVEDLRIDPGGTTWANYETDHRYAPAAMTDKQEVVRSMLAQLKPECVWDLGANTGAYSGLAPAGTRVVAIDGDHSAVEMHYRRVRGESRTVLPLVMDLRNPSPTQGWRGAEHKSLADRGPADAVLALALVHHLVLGAGVPFTGVAEWLRGIGRFAIIEFIPLQDPQAQRLVATRVEATHPYSEDEFRKAFERHFDLRRRHELAASGRVLYLAEAKRGPR